MITEVWTEVKTYRVQGQCDCGGELVVCAGETLFTSPAQYPHECLGCGRRTHVAGKSYPYHVTREIGDD